MGKKALLIMDCENDMLDAKGKGAGFGIAAHAAQVGTVKNIQSVLMKARENKLKVIFVTVSYAKGYPELKDAKTPMHSQLNGSGMLLKGEWGSEIVPALKPIKGEVVFNKSMISPFTVPGFVKEIQGIDTFYLTGVATNFVVEATAREAADRKKEVIILKDCCASMNQEMHDFSLNVISNLAKIKTSKDVEF